MSYKNLYWLRGFFQFLYRLIYVRVFNMDISPLAKFSLSVKFDKTNPRGVHVGDYSYVAFGVAVLTHDLTRGVRRNTVIGKNCFVGANSIIMPGVTIHDGSIVGAGSVVTRDVISGVIVAGNPAVVIKSGVVVGHYGRLSSADITQSIEEKNFE